MQKIQGAVKAFGKAVPTVYLPQLLFPQSLPVPVGLDTDTAVVLFAVQFRDW